ncbi:uncharacterized protein K02A2.6-like [Saccostrea echinata]|uniref:uncharacterized protein K02A2.6-like n=1 Tax=Saccostrea echinata TaxID=191078 RepID=UPI002A7F7C95|nr:uncharacterized protein K02A2.6-like [Saccostrea echinata]
MNHFETVCRSASKKSQPKYKKKTVHHTGTGCSNTDSDDDYSVWTIQEENTHSAHTVSNSVHASMVIYGKKVTFQLDSGATCNILPSSVIPNMPPLQPTDYTLKMYNKSTIRPLGKTHLQVTNPRNGTSYDTEFVVIKEDCMPLLGNKSLQHMELLNWRKENILSVRQLLPSPLSKKQLLAEYPDVFEGVGRLAGKYHLVLDENIQPVVHPPRKVPIALKPLLKAELDRLQEMNIITPISEPTQWVSSCLMVMKPNKVRICIDPKDLNKALKRSHYPLPTIEEILPNLSRAKVFSVLDARNGFWHVELDKESSMLTTFNTPFGRFRWLRMPFGISTAPEEYQRRQDQAVEGLPGVLSIADDILVYGEGDTGEDAILDHDQKLKALMKRCRERGLVLNKDKLRLRETEVRFVGHLITKDGLKPDPEKVKAVNEMPNPTDVAGLRRFLGFVNYLSKFLPSLSDICEPLRKLTVKDTLWSWHEIHDQAVEKVKRLVTSKPVLSYYDPNKELTLQCDSSETGLGAALLQLGKPIAFASRALTDTETRYSQIEKELLAVVFGLEKFHQYTYGRNVTVQSDHKPLEIIMKKPLHTAPKRLQRMLLRLQKYSTKLEYRPGKEMHLADALSRAYLQNSDRTGALLDEIVHFTHLQPTLGDSLQEIRDETRRDRTLQDLIHVILTGWPKTVSEVKDTVRPYFNFRDELVVQDAVIFRGDRIVIPISMRQDMLCKIHKSHIGVEGSLRRARENIFWPGMNAETRDFISRCEICRSLDDKQCKETLRSHEVPDKPWGKIACDIFTFDGQDYLVTVDYFSNFWEVDHLSRSTSKTVIKKLRAHFARYGTPNSLVSDNGPQFSSDEFAEFTHLWEFKHITSSPKYPQSNGRAEQAVKMAKRLMKRAVKSNSDPYLALLDFRNTPTQGMGTSPAQRLMSRRTKTLLPTKQSLLVPEVPDLKEQGRKLVRLKERQAHYYNHGAKDLKPLKIQDLVRIAPPDGIGQSREWKKGVVTKVLPNRSYEVQSDGQHYRSNRRHLRPSKHQEQSESDDIVPEEYSETGVEQEKPIQPPDSKQMTESAKEQVTFKAPQAITRSGRQVKVPIRFKDYVK